MVALLLGNERSDLNRFTLVTPKSENDVRLQATLDNQNPTGLPVGAVRNAIIVGTQIKLNNEDFIKGLKKAKKIDTVLLGISIKNVAKASLHLIGIEKYKGDDPSVIKLIESKFKI